MAGEFEGQNWISSTGYYVGQFVRDWIGLKATKTLSYIRYGEFQSASEKGQAVESYIYLDIPELMIACNHNGLWIWGQGYSLRIHRADSRACITRWRPQN